MIDKLSLLDPWETEVWNRWPIDSFRKLFDDREIARNVESPMDIYETGTELVFQVAFPGVPLENWDINIADNVLTIKAVKQADELKEDTKYYKKDWSYRSQTLSTSYRLPANLDIQAASAGYKDGVLKLSIPKLEQKTDQSIKISVT